MARPAPTPGSHVAVFADKRHRYLADTCRPLEEAVEQGLVTMAALARGGYPGKRMESGVLSGVSTIGYWDAPVAQRWGLDWHRNEGLELTFLERGSVAFSVSAQQAKLKPGALTVTRPWQPHRVGAPHVGASRLHWLIIDVGVRRPNQPWRWPDWIQLDKADLERLTERFRHNEEPVWNANEDVRQCWQRIGAAVASGTGKTQHSRLRVLVNELLLLLLELFESHDAPLDPSLTTSERTVDLFLSELRDHAAQRALPWTVAQMAERCGLGATHFAKLCQKLTNRTPGHFLRHCRIESVGARLLADPEVSITEAAIAEGFSSAQYFATAFRAEKGVSPRDWRRTPKTKSPAA
ncbi:helix-turn-helix domain-containing protein [Nibricoccus sp. IMCC34717]|uniref:AraC family transcriptional regulator n=1 Tax=Nibricoccus sp. IMCC34717 TaxID=3034021 RepID=UPI00384C5929